MKETSAAWDELNCRWVELLSARSSWSSSHQTKLCLIEKKSRAGWWSEAWNLMFNWQKQQKRETIWIETKEIHHERKEVFETKTSNLSRIKWKQINEVEMFISLLTLARYVHMKKRLVSLVLKLRSTSSSWFLLLLFFLWCDTSRIGDPLLWEFNFSTLNECRILFSAFRSSFDFQGWPGQFMGYLCAALIFPGIFFFIIIISLTSLISK